MIVPRSRLLVWVGLIVLPFATLGGVESSAFVISAAVIGALLFVVLLDAALAFGRLDGLSVELPEVSRLSKDRDLALEVRVRNERQTAREIRLALDFPRAIQSANDEMQVALPVGSEWSRFTWPCRSSARGNFPVTRAFVEGVSPLGFWAVRATLPVRGELRVYPNLLAERKNLAALFLNRRGAGLHTQRQVGQGRDFEKLREYIPGDSLDEIHWKATAKRGRPVTKVFQIERTREIYVVIDSSRLSGRKVESGKLSVESRNVSPLSTLHPPPSTALERFITTSLILGLAAEKQGDLFGLITFSDQVGTFLRARNGPAHYHACRDALHTLEARTVTPDFEELASFIRLRLRRRALLLFLTSLDDPALAESFTRGMDLIARQHLVLVNMIQPAGARPLFTDDKVENADGLYDRLGGHLRWRQLRELEKTLQRRGVRFAQLDPDKFSAQLVTQYLGVKQRQLL